MHASQRQQADRSGTPASRKRRRPLSMHEDVAVWCDCCSCEAEPRWQAVEDDLERQRQTEREKQ